MSCKIITVFSNKGGVGKTFVSVNTAAALAVKGQQVLLVDFDLMAGQDMARMLNLSGARSLVDILGEVEKDNSPNLLRKYITKHVSGMDFLPSVSHLRQAGHISSDNIRPFLK